MALGCVLLLGIGGDFAQQPFFQLRSGEMFPSLIRSTAQGLMFATSCADQPYRAHKGSELARAGAPTPPDREYGGGFGLYLVDILAQRMGFHER